MPNAVLLATSPLLRAFSNASSVFTAGVWLLLSLSSWPLFEIDGWFWQELFYFLLANVVISAVCGSARGSTVELL